MDQAISTQAQFITTQPQAMTTKDNWTVVPQANQYVGTMVSSLRSFSRINPPTFYGSKVEEDPIEFINET